MMKKIDPPFVDDIAEISEMARNTNLENHDVIFKFLNDLLRNYHLYSCVKGDPWEVISYEIESDFKDRLQSLYKNNPKNRLKFIKEYRYKLSPDFCPMCGSLKTGTLDHYLPQEDYPVFSIFSKNLVPACDCNSRRKRTVKGEREPSRVIHPYYDEFVKDRLYKSKFSGDFEAPHIEMVLVDNSHNQKEILEFHLDKVILSNRIVDWLESRWSAMFERPHKLLRSYLPEGRVSKEIVERAIREKLIDSDDEYETPNNWFSFFYAGLLDNEIRLNDIASKLNVMRGF
jgi:hypothetical protein